MAHALDVDQFDVVAGREVLDVGHAVDYGETPAVVEDIKSAGLGDLGGKCGDTLVETAKRFGLAEVIEEHGLEAAHRVFATVDAQRTVDVAVVGGQQLVEDVHAQIARSTCEQYVAHGLALPVKEGTQVVPLQMSVDRRELRIGCGSIFFLHAGFHALDLRFFIL